MKFSNKIENWNNFMKDSLRVINYIILKYQTEQFIVRLVFTFRAKQGEIWDETEVFGSGFGHLYRNIGRGGFWFLETALYGVVSSSAKASPCATKADCRKPVSFAAPKTRLSRFSPCRACTTRVISIFRTISAVSTHTGHDPSYPSSSLFSLLSPSSFFILLLAPSSRVPLQQRRAGIPFSMFPMETSVIYLNEFLWMRVQIALVLISWHEARFSLKIILIRGECNIISQ